MGMFIDTVRMFIDTIHIQLPTFWELATIFVVQLVKFLTTLNN